MESITRLVDIPYLFKRLGALPGELATVRHNVWLETQELTDVTLAHENAQAVALETAAEDYAACKNAEQRKQFKALLFQRDTNVVVAACNMITVEAELSASKNALADLKDEQTSLRYTIRLISSLTLGSDTMPANVLYDKLLSALLEQREGYVIGEAVNTTSPPAFDAPSEFEKDVNEA